MCHRSRVIKLLMLQLSNHHINHFICWLLQTGPAIMSAGCWQPCACSLTVLKKFGFAVCRIIHHGNTDKHPHPLYKLNIRSVIRWSRKNSGKVPSCDCDSDRSQQTLIPRCNQINQVIIIEVASVVPLCLTYQRFSISWWSGRSQTDNRLGRWILRQSQIATLISSYKLIAAHLYDWHISGATSVHHENRITNAITKIYCDRWKVTLCAYKFGTPANDH